MQKYLNVVAVGIQNTLVYRVNFLFRAVFALIPLMATIFLWRAVYEGKGEGSIAGYTLSHMISYYLVVMIVDALTGVTEDDWQIAADIRDGNISQLLLKPVDYLWYRLSLFFSGRLVYIAVAFIPVGLFIFFHRDYFVLPRDAATLGWFGISLAMTAMLQFFTSFAMALLAFWVLEVSTFIFILYALEYVAGGHLFPIDILPPVAAQILSYTPFPYLMFLPVSIYLGQTSGPELYKGLLIQAFWVAAAYALARWVWARGLKRYSAVGG